MKKDILIDRYSSKTELIKLFGLYDPSSWCSIYCQTSDDHQRSDAGDISEKEGDTVCCLWILCVVFTLIWARIAAVFANKATPKMLNRVTGVILVLLGMVVLLFS